MQFDWLLSRTRNAKWEYSGSVAHRLESHNTLCQDCRVFKLSMDYQYRSCVTKGMLLTSPHHKLEHRHHYPFADEVFPCESKGNGPNGGNLARELDKMEDDTGPEILFQCTECFATAMDMLVNRWNRMRSRRRVQANNPSCRQIAHRPIARKADANWTAHD